MGRRSWSVHEMDNPDGWGVSCRLTRSRGACPLSPWLRPLESVLAKLGLGNDHARLPPATQTARAAAFGVGEKTKRIGVSAALPVIIRARSAC